MRPDREEMLAGIRRGLVEYVGGEVSTVYARTQLTYALNLIAAIARESEDAVANLVDENARLRSLFGEASAELRESGHIKAGLRGDLANAARAPNDVDLRLGPLRRENSALLDLFVRLQSACEQAPQDQNVDRVYRSTLAFLRQRVESSAGLPRRS